MPEDSRVWLTKVWARRVPGIKVMEYARRDMPKPTTPCLPASSIRTSKYLCRIDGGRAVRTSQRIAHKIALSFLRALLGERHPPQCAANLHAPTVGV